MTVNGGDCASGCPRDREGKRSNSAGAAAQTVALEEQALGQLGWPIKQRVVEDRVFVVDSGACPDDGFAFLRRIPGKTDLRSKLRVGLPDGIAQRSSLRVHTPLIQQRSAAGARCSRSQQSRRSRARNGCQIAVRAAGVTVVTQAVGKGKVGLDLPGIAHIPLQTVVVLAARREAEAWFLGEEALAVAQIGACQRVVNRVVGSAAHWARGGFNEVEGGDPEKFREPAAVNVVVANTVAEDVRTIHLAAVVLDLLVALEGLLRGQQVGSRQLETLVNHQDLGRRQRIVETGALGGVADEVVELQIAKAEAVRPGALTPVNTHPIRWRVVPVRVGLVVIAEVGFRLVPVVGKTVENVNVLGGLPVQLARDFAVTERRKETSGKLTEGGRYHQRQQSVLLHAFAVHEEEQLILDDWPAHAAAEVVALIVT